MVLLRRVGDVVQLWLPVIAALLICYAVTAWSAGRQSRPAAGISILPLRPGERRGPSVEELIDRCNRMNPQNASPPGVVE